MHDYQLFTVDDVQRDEAAILGVLTAIMDRKLPNDMKLLNYFREIPVSFGAEIKFVDNGMVEMAVHQTQAVAILDQKMAFIKSTHLRHDVIAKVQRIRIAKQQVFFTQFAYVKIPSERRENVRVKVTRSFEVLFQSDELLVKGMLNDISVSGLSMLVADRLSLDEGLSGMLSVSIPGMVLDIPGVLLRILSTENLYKYVFRLETTSKIELAISQFIFQLQTEIIRELKDQV
jgi:hypothetical protein